MYHSNFSIINQTNNKMARRRRGVKKGPKLDDIIYEQPLMVKIHSIDSIISV